jgi:acyl carrier protein
MADTLCELQAMLAAYCSVSAMEIDTDCPLHELGMDAVGLKDLIVAIEDKFKLVLSEMLDEDFNIVRTDRQLGDQTLQQLAWYLNRLIDETEAL